MKDVRIEKSKVLTELTMNLSIHEKEFKEAVDEYWTTVVAKLEGVIEKARKREKFDNFINLPEPVNYSESYRTAIKMCQYSADEFIVLTRQEFTQYIEDNWEWKEGFKNTRQLYASEGAYIGKK